MAEHVLHGSGHQFATLFEADQCGSDATPDERKAIASRTVVEFSKPVEKFLENFVPSQTPCPRRYTRGIFQGAQGKDQKALSMGIALALEDLTKDFPTAKRLRFAYQGDRLIPLTIGEHTAPDDQLRATIVSSFPGQSAAADPQWDKISLVVQVNPHLTYDPLGSDPAWEEGMLQILRAARNMLVVNHSLFVFVIGIYQNQARIFRVDHSSAVASKLFNFRRRPGLIRSFLWRFVHPSACTTVAGADPSVSKPTKRDLQWARKILGSTPQSPAIMNACRWFTVEDSAQRNAARHFLIFKPIFVSLTLFARATQVWEAIERGDKTRRRFVIKNAWRSCQEYDAETRIYQHLRNELSPGQQLLGVAEMVCGLDLGEAEVSNNSAAQESESTAAVSTPPVSRTRLTIRTPPQRNPRSGMQTRASKAILATRNKAEPAGHRTTCAFGRNNTSDAPCERSHMRLVIWPVGKSLVEFQSIRELTETLRDAIIGHEQLCDAGVLHRDISNENIMISTDARFKGFLCDFDLSVLLQELDSYPCATGTWYFRAVELLERPRWTMHKAVHDLEAFFWVLVWTVLDQLDRSHLRDPQIINWLFSFSSPDECAKRKREWLYNSEYDLSVPGAEAFSELLAGYSQLIRWTNIKAPDRWKYKLTHEDVLALFDKALAKSGWPDDRSLQVYLGSPPAEAQSAQEGAGDLHNEDTTEPQAGEHPAKGKEGAPRTMVGEKRRREDEDGTTESSSLKRQRASTESENGIVGARHDNALPS